MRAAVDGRSRRRQYLALVVFAAAFGWVEGCVVVYLRDVYLRDAAGPTGGVALPVTAVALPARVVAIEVVREACTLLMLASVGWLAATTMAGRAGAFLVAFGVWDLVYYLTLWIVLSWPESLSTWDILFLIPVPWVAPVWAPMLVASAFVSAGSWLFFAEHRRRAWRWVDVAGVVVAAALILGSFLVESSAAVEHRVPARYPAWLLWLGMALGIGCFLRVERRAGDEATDSA